MVAFICLILGIIYAFKRPGIAKMDRSTFPGASESEFDAWKRAELSSIDIFLWATWGQTIVFVVLALLLGIFTAQSGGRTLAEDLTNIMTVIQIIVFVAGIILSAVVGTRAQKLKAAFSGGR